MKVNDNAGCLETPRRPWVHRRQAGSYRDRVRSQGVIEQPRQIRAPLL